MARIFRVFPLRLSILAIFLFLEGARAVVGAYGLSIGGQPFTGHLAASQIFPNATLLQAWLPWTDPLSFNAPSWSISIEIYMYLMFAASLMLSAYRPAVCFALAGCALYLNATWSDLITLEAQRGIACFFAGSCAYLTFCAIEARWRPRRVIACAAKIACILAVVSLLTIGISSEIIAVALFSCLVFGFAFEEGPVSLILKSRISKRAGELSFSIYMIHYFIIIIVTHSLMMCTKLMSRSLVVESGAIRFIDLGNRVANNLFAALIVAVVIAFAFITLRYVERPGRALGKICSAKLSLNAVRAKETA